MLVLEGAARPGVPEGGTDLRTVHAAGEGDDTIVVEAERLVGEGHQVAVVTADRGLRERVGAVGAQVRGPGWLLDHLVRARP